MRTCNRWADSPSPVEHGDLHRSEFPVECPQWVVNVDYDKFCLRNIVPHPEALTQHDTLDIVELAGSQGVEILNWLAARGALTGSLRELAHNYHVPISNTAAATLLVENKAVAHALTRLWGP